MTIIILKVASINLIPDIQSILCTVRMAAIYEQVKLKNITGPAYCDMIGIYI